MPNEVLFFIEVVACFGVLLLINRYLEKEGLIAWIAIASILANILTTKNIDAFGITYTLGTVMFSSIFLATDILTERFGAKAAKKGVITGMVATLCLILFTQIGILYAPSAIDYIDASLREVFSLSFRVSISSVVMYFVANMVDVYLYEHLREKMNGKHMWFRNNVSTILCNTLENFLFMFGAFFKIFEVRDILMMAVTTSIIEIVVGLLDTPFLYIATRNERKIESDLNSSTIE